MRFTTIEVGQTDKLDATPTLFYNILKAQMDDILVPIKVLLTSPEATSEFFAWLATVPESFVWSATYNLLDPLTTAPILENEFLIHASKLNPDGGIMKVNIAIRGNEMISSARVDFNGRMNQNFAGRTINALRLALDEKSISWDTIRFRAEGYIREQHISEVLLAAFYYDEGHETMLHKKLEAQVIKQAVRR